MKVTLHWKGSEHVPPHVCLTLSRTNLEEMLRALDDSGGRGSILDRAGALPKYHSTFPVEPSISVAVVEDRDHYPHGSTRGRLYSPHRNHYGEQLDLLDPLS